MARYTFVSISIVAPFALCAMSLAAPTPELLPAPPAGYVWRAMPQLTDEFNGKRVDKTKWLTHHPYWNGREPSRFDPDNVSVAGGYLQLHSDTQLTNLSTIKDPKKDVWVRSSCLASTAPLARFGYYEARLKASDLSMTSSFWLQGKYSEIDVVEEIGHSEDEPGKGQLMLMNTHFYRDGWPLDKATPKDWVMPTSSAQDYHVYGVWWKDANTVDFYHNGVQVAHVNTGGAFDEPMYLFFDTEVFTWTGLPTLGSLKDPRRNTMSVDWVRSWRLVPYGSNGLTRQNR